MQESMLLVWHGCTVMPVAATFSTCLMHIHWWQCFASFECRISCNMCINATTKDITSPPTHRYSIQHKCVMSHGRPFEHKALSKAQTRPAWLFLEIPGHGSLQIEGLRSLWQPISSLTASSFGAKSLVLLHPLCLHHISKPSIENWVEWVNFHCTMEKTQLSPSADQSCVENNPFRICETVVKEQN